MRHLLGPIAIALVGVNSLVRFLWHAMTEREGRVSRVLAMVSTVLSLVMFVVIYARSLRTRTYLAMIDAPESDLYLWLFERARGAEEWLLANASVLGRRYAPVTDAPLFPVVGFALLMAVRAGIYFFAGRRAIATANDDARTEPTNDEPADQDLDALDSAEEPQLAADLEPSAQEPRIASKTTRARRRRANTSLWGSVYWTHGTAYFLTLCALAAGFDFPGAILWPLGILALVVAPLAIRFSVLGDLLNVVGTIAGAAKDVVIAAWGYLTDGCVRLARFYRRLMTGSTEWYRRTVSAPIDRRMDRISERTDRLRENVEHRFDATESSFSKGQRDDPPKRTSGRVPVTVATAPEVEGSAPFDMPPASDADGTSSS